MLNDSSNIGQGDKVFISTYGCQMNDHDTERMYSLLESNKFLQATSAEDADVIIINSCSVREKPVHKVRSEVGTYKDLKSQKPNLKIGVGGCVGQQEGKNLLKGNPTLDFVFGTDTIDSLPEIIGEVRKDDVRKAWTRMGHRDPYSIATRVRQTKVTAFVTITKGCDNFCSFCVVPFTRGRERSRLLSEIVNDIHSLVDRGVQEVTLLGQNVNSFNSPDGNGGFNDLLRAICNETDLKRLRFTTSHPKDFDDDLIDVLVKYQSKLGHYLHLPVQSGNSRILQRMNRGYTREEYMEKILRFQKALPEAAISTDIIVGFPGETESEFEDTLSMLQEIEYENVYAFKYSPRPFTQALKFTEQVPEEQKSARLATINDLQKELAPSISKKYEGRTLDVLIEGPSRANKEVLMGRTTHNKVVHIEDSRDLIGKIVPTKITRSQSFVLWGEVI